MLASICNNIISKKQNKSRRSSQVILWENPLVFIITCTVNKSELCLVLWLILGCYHVITIIPSKLNTNRSFNSSGPESGCFPENIHYSGILGSLWMCRNRCTQGVLCFTWPTALAWERFHVTLIYSNCFCMRTRLSLKQDWICQKMCCP